MSKPVELGSLKIGSYILLPVSDQPTGDPCRISEYDTSKPGKHGAAKARIVGVGVFDGQKRPHVGPVSMQVHVPLIDKRTGQIISMTGSEIQVMDGDNIFDYRIFMNNVLNYRGYRFFQSSYDSDEKGTILSVNKDKAGTIVTYIGYLCLLLSVISLVIFRFSRFNILSRNINKK